MGIAVGSIETTREATNDLLVGEFLDRGSIGVDDGLRLNEKILLVSESWRKLRHTHNLRAGTDGLLAKNVETTLNGLDRLFGVDGSSAGNDNGL